MEPTVQNRGVSKKETVFNDSFEEFFLGPESNGRKSAEMVAFTLEYFRKRPHLWKSDDSDDEETNENTILKEPNSLYNSDRNDNQRERKYQKHTKSVFDTTICPTTDRGSPKALVKTKAPSKGYEFFKKHLNWKSKGDVGKDSNEKKTYDNRRSNDEYFTTSGGERESRSHSKPRIIYTKAESSSQLSKYSSHSPATRYSRAPPSEAETTGRSKSRTRSRSKITSAQRESPESHHRVRYESPESHRRVRYESPRRSNYKTEYSRRINPNVNLGADPNRQHETRSRSQPRITSTLIESPRSDYSSPKRIVRGTRVAKECSKNKHISRERLTPTSIYHQEMKDATRATLVVTPTPNCSQEMFDAARRTLVLTPSPGSIGQSHGSMHVSIQLQYRQPSPR